MTSVFPDSKPVAIVGIATQLPSGRHADRNLNHNDFFWFLMNHYDAYEKIPSDRFNIDYAKGQGLGRVVTDKGAFLKNVTHFDFLEFGVSRQDSRYMALSTRKLIEISFLALLDSGIEYRTRNVGCFTAGVAYEILSMGDADELEAKGSFAGAPSMIANRVSYHLDLLGPSIPLDTACSSSLSALHLAMQALRAGDCESAVVASSQVNHRFVDWAVYSQGGILSPDGKCKPFDASADGFSRGEGVAAIVVKLLDDAIRDGDYIYATVLGTGLSANGSAAPASAPVAAGQREAMLQAYRGIGRLPSEVDFVELHATGTSAGDPVEANWVGEEFKRARDLPIGSVKGNTGHLEVTAFLASLSKICSIFEHGIIPPTVNVTTLNPAIKWDEYRLRVLTEATPLLKKTNFSLPFISVCSSGIGGANGHAVIEAPPISTSYDYRKPEAPVLLFAGGLTPRSAAAVGEQIDELVSDSADILALSTVYGRRVRQMTWRTYSIRYPDGSNNTKFLQPVHVPRSRPPLVFAMTGQGPQHIHMGRQLFETYPVFRNSVLEMDRIHEEVTGTSLIRVSGLFDSSACEGTPTIPNASVPVAMTMVQIALIDFFSSLGIKPDVVVGHSAGEPATLYACGAASKALAIEISVARGTAVVGDGKPYGTMAALSCTAEEARAIIQEVTGSDGEGMLEIACLNARNAVALSGTEVCVERAIKLAKRDGFLAQRIYTPIPAHSSLVERYRSEYVKLVGACFLRHPDHGPPKIPTYSGWTGELWTEPFSADYFWSNTRKPVLFHKAIASIHDAYPTANFLEISPHPALTPYIVDTCASSVTVMCPMRRFREPQPHDESCNLLKVVGRLSMLGYNSIKLEPTTGYSFSTRFGISLPEYPFAPKDVPYLPESSVTVTRQNAACNGPLHREGGIRLNALTHPELADHVILGETIMPASGFLEMAFEIGARTLREVEFMSMLALPIDKVVHVDVEENGLVWGVSSYTEGARRSQVKRAHLKGYFSRSLPEESAQDMDIESLKQRCTPFPLNGFYETLAVFAQYGPSFRRISAIYRNDDEALIEVQGGEVEKSYILHPAILDASIHAIIHPSFTGDSDRNSYYLPSRVQSVVLHTILDHAPEALYTYVSFRRWNPESIVFDFVVMDHKGRRLCTMTEFEIARHEMRIGASSVSVAYDIVLQPSGVSLEEDQKQSNESFPTKQIQNDGAAPLIYDFKRGMEMNFQKWLREAKLAPGEELWITAVSPLNAAVARPFSRSLRKELFGVRIHLVTFDLAQDDSTVLRTIQRLRATDSLEDEVHIGCTGDILVPRLVPIPVLSNQDAFNSEEYWMYTKTGVLSHGHSPPCPQNQLSVRVLLSEPATAGVWAFSGIITDASSVSGFTKGSAVIGISSSPLSNYVIAQEGSICQMNDVEEANLFVGILLPIIIVTLTLGNAAHQPRCLTHNVFVTNTDTHTGRGVTWILSSLDVRFVSVCGNPRIDDLPTIAASDVVLTGVVSDPDVYFLQASSSASTRIFFWNRDSTGIQQAISGHLIGDALCDMLPRLTRPPSSIIAHCVEPAALLSSETKSSPRTLLDSQKTYVLLGGIGSFGVRCALWMYENGAQQIILTSRSGKSTLARHRDITAARILSYLEKLSDLHLHADAYDSTSSSDMISLFGSISPLHPVGGIILLSAVLSDGLFDTQTAESYSIPFKPKVGTLEALMEVYPIEKLDFLVSISSATTFGNAGQTNYVSANALVDEMLRPYPNATSIVAPAIIDTRAIAAEIGDRKAKSQLAHLSSWSMLSKEICDCIGHVIRILRSVAVAETRKPSIYIPNLNWSALHRDFGASALYSHLVESGGDGVGSQVNDGGDGENPIQSLQALVLRFLDVNPADFSPEIPFTSYGLDSLSAGRMAFALGPWITMTQVQLLADVSFNDLVGRIQESQQ